MRHRRNSIWPFTAQDVKEQSEAMDRLKSQEKPIRLLRVETDYFVAGASWKKIAGIWSCIQAAPILRWMVGMTGWQAKMALLKMGASYQFLDPKIMGPSHGVGA